MKQVRIDEEGEALQALAREDIELALRKVLESPGFARNSNSARFLKFIVEETLAGRGERLKAFTVATLALGRGVDFNPQSSSIVRVQAMRLRELLDEYYEGPGALEPLRVLLPLGSYRPVFVFANPRGGAAPLVADEARPANFAPARGSGAARLRAGAFMLGIAAILAAAAAFSPFHWRQASAPPHANEIAARPVVVVLPAEVIGAADAAQTVPARFLGALENGLSAFDYLDVRRNVAGPGGLDHVDYAVSGSFIPVAQHRFEIQLRVLREPTGEVLWSHRYDDVDGGDNSAFRALTQTATTTIGDVGGGAIFADLRARMALVAAPTSGYACVLFGLEYLRERIESQRVPARRCLEAALVDTPDDPGVLTTLSTLLVISYLNAPPEGRGHADLEQALKLARRAYEVAPQRAVTQTALFFARFYDKRFDDAFQAARQAVPLNPSSAMLMARIARGYICRERYEEGLALLRPFETSNEGPPASSLGVLALVALMRDETPKAYDYAMRTGAAASPLGVVTRIIACDRRGDAECVAAASTLLRDRFPGFARDIPAALERHALSDTIKATLISGLAHAGFKPEM